MDHIHGGAEFFLSGTHSMWLKAFKQQDSSKQRHVTGGTEERESGCSRTVI